MKRSYSTKSILLATALALGIATANSTAEQKHQWTNFVSDINGVAPVSDSNLVNPWGLVPGEEGKTLWVANNGTGTLTRYNLKGQPFVVSGNSDPEVVTIPPAVGNSTGVPTGLVLNHAAFDSTRTNEFLIPPNTAGAKPSRLLTVTEDGLIVGFNPNADASNGIVGRTVAGAVYKGLALAFVSGGAGQPDKHRLFAANFATGKIDVFESDFSPVTLAQGAFSDVDAGFAPFNIKRYAHRDPLTKSTLRVLLVAYAKINQANPGDDEAGPGNGYVSVYKTDGTLVGRLVAHSANNGLNSPWGMAIQRGRSQNKDTLLVGNFGDGTIHAFNLNGVFADSLPHPATDEGPLLGKHGNPLVFDNLWALHFSQTPESIKQFSLDDDELGPDEEGALYFTAGIVDENDGLMGKITH